MELLVLTEYDRMLQMGNLVYCPEIIMGKRVPSVDFETFANLYCETQICDPSDLRSRLRNQRKHYRLDGWFMLECQMLDGSRLGERTILPYGPRNTYKAVPNHPVSPRGLASDMSTVIAVMTANELGET